MQSNEPHGDMVLPDEFAQLSKTIDQNKAIEKVIVANNTEDSFVWSPYH